MASSFDLSTLSQWKDERASSIIYKPFELDQSLDYFDKISDVAGNNVLLPVIDDEAPVQVNASCAFIPDANATSIKQFSITAPLHAVDRGWCLRDLEQYFTKQWLPNKEEPNTLDVIDELVGRTLMKATRRMAITNWIGDTAIGAYPADYKGRNGVLKQVAGLIPTGQQYTLAIGATINSSNVISVFDTVISQMPTSTLAGGEPVLFCGSDVFRILLIALREKNYFHYQYDITANPDTMTLKPIVYPGSNVLVVPTLGLNSDNDANQPLSSKQRLIATYRGNLAFGFKVNEGEFDVWYSQDFKQLRMTYTFHAGVGVKFPELISEFHLS